VTRRLLSTLALAALVVLATRAVVYALEPAPLAQELGSATPGPRPLLVGLVVLALARRRGPRPLLRLRRAVVHATATFAVSSLAFALVESYVHWRAGLGLHGLHCLFGPVHRDALPFLAALAALGAAAWEAAAHVLAWMRRTLALLLRPIALPTLALAPVAPTTSAPRSSRRERPGDPRGPPFA
jgi:hypothetical protein